MIIEHINRANKQIFMPLRNMQEYSDTLLCNNQELELKFELMSVQHWNTKNYFDYFKKVYDLAKKNAKSSVQVRTLSYIINSFVSLRTVSERTMIYIQQAELFLSEDIHPEDIRVRIRLHSTLILANLILREYNTAEHHATQLYKLYQLLQETPHPLYDCIVASMYYESEEYEKSWTLLFRAENEAVQRWEQYYQSPELFSTIDYHRLCLATNNICKLSAILCLRFNNIIAAEEYIRFGLDFIKDDKYDSDKSVLWGICSNIYLHKKQYNEALQCGLKVLEIYNTSRAPFVGMLGHIITGTVYFALQDIKNALANAEKSWFYATKFRDKTGRLHPLIFYIECLLSANKDIDKVPSLLELLNEYFNETRQQYLLFKKFHVESIYYQKIGETEKALEALQQCNKLVKQVNSLDIATDFNKALSIPRRSFLQGTALFQSLKSSMNTNADTTLATTSLSEKVMFQDLFQGIQATVKKLYQEAPMLSKREIQQRLADINRLLADNFHERQELHDLQKELSHAHGEFLPIISRQFPQLSHTELRICVLLRLNMTTHQIADALAVAPDTVFTHRKNIRKKMNIPKSVELHTFLLALEENPTNE